MNRLDTRTAINVLALVRGKERYVFLFDDDSAVETLRQFGRYAVDPELDFTWYDAVVLSMKVRTVVGADAGGTWTG